MSYRVPTRRLKKRQDDKLNLIPILDSVFILVFFLLMSAQFVKLFEINSDAPIIANTPPPKNQKKPLALTVEINKNNLAVYTGVPARRYTQISNIGDTYDLIKLHQAMIQIKKNNPSEKTVVLEPNYDIDYETLVKIMDAVRKMEVTDEAIFTKDKDGLDIKLQHLFTNIMFGNLMS